MRVYKPSGIKWLGEIPQSWEIKPLQAIFNQRNEQNNNLEFQTILSLVKDVGVIPYEEKGNVGNKAKDDLQGYKIARVNDLVLNKMNAVIGSLGVSKYDGLVSPIYLVLYIENPNYLIAYYSYLFQTKSIQKFLRKFAYGIMEIRESIDYLEFKKMFLPTPPLQEQKEIAEFLDKKCEKIQNYINKKQKLITLLQEKKQALINEAVCGRVACHTERSEVSTTAYKPSGIEYLGLIPHHWEAVKVKFTAYVKGRIGFHGLNSNEFRYDEGAYLVTGNDFDNNEVMWDKCRRVSEERFYEDPNIHLQNNDLLITKDGTIGKTAIVNNCPKQATLNSGIFLVRTMKKMCFVKYLFFIINSQYFKEFVNVKTSGSTIKHLYQSDFHDLKIPLPPLQEQKQIANFLDEKCEKINSAIEKTKRQIELIKEYKNTFINEAVCGRINFLEGILNE
ncbi:restriction endonuclease subunit S [Campylobacter upsaliensis]|uniref:restriction endonuclease subunit S n=1 Tax=Campylobacter upsaliensis TaxID=28080 RepID=UPI0022EA90E4|nr:restriction endonuclease subunit S [Campylobacter upsaliensis]MEB2787702.1 restriction endonuclease subunit S [Campylobacter upsaliensis]MEB2796764.1 restriction endonuclease subunit S [Campylobacter upsaliensis]